MLKNFSPKALGINGRQSELIELALTYGFRSMDIDMYEILRRSGRTSAEDAAKFVKAAMIDERVGKDKMGRLEGIGGFELEVNLDATDEEFKAQVATLHPLVELAEDLEATRAYITLPAATDSMPYHEFFDAQGTRVKQIAEVLGTKNIQLGISFDGSREPEHGKQYDFVRNVEGLIAFVKSVGVANVGYIIDTWDWVVGDGGMDQLSEIAGSDIIAIRLGTLAADVDPAKATRGDRELPTLEGGLNHVSVVKQAIQAGFEGPICPSASPSRYKGQTRENTVKQSQEAIDKISEEAGLEVKPLPMDLIEEIPVETTPLV
ncbi:MAG: TIM barrel protein [Planctomycetota bacterium]